jgi:hypothetical protein
MEPVMTVLAFLFFGFIAIVLLVIAIKTILIVPEQWPQHPRSVSR